MEGSVVAEALDGPESVDRRALYLQIGTHSSQTRTLTSAELIQGQIDDLSSFFEHDSGIDARERRRISEHASPQRRLLQHEARVENSLPGAQVGESACDFQVVASVSLTIGTIWSEPMHEVENKAPLTAAE